jgi:hypothetical protein
MNKQMHTPKFQIGQHVKYGSITLGHDPEWLKTKGARVTHVYKGVSSRDTSYKIEGSESIHPETRLT